MKQFGRIFSHKGLQFAEATSTLIGAVIGAGVLGIPYAVAQIGFWPGMAMLIGLTIANTFLIMMYTEVTLRTKADHEIPGYGGVYLGFPTQILVLLVVILGGYGTLLAYLIAQGDVLQALFGGSNVVWSFVFFMAGGYIIYRGLNAVRIIELIMTIGIFVILFLIGLKAHPHINGLNYMHINLHNFIIPYGVLIFALSGISAVPQVRLQMQNDERKLPLVVITANILIFVMYALFMWLVLGVTGLDTTEVATIGLGQRIGPTMLILGNVLAFFTISTSFITVGLSVRRIFQYDYKFSRFKAWISTMIVPMVIFLLGARSFIAVVGIVGGVLVGIQCVVIIMAFWKSIKNGGRKPEFTMKSFTYVGVILLLLYALGAILTVIDVI